jgi:hypothetical protein
MKRVLDFTVILDVVWNATSYLLTDASVSQELTASIFRIVYAETL